ncbi:helix-turn-helix domain-containing protein [Hyphomicrobium sp.]|jgi:DNA-binding transcriptional MocR family regulator|uniref:helix-turn-helix domain-containing protein n=1 Tax=Hyphomicrobium sp. TaxID=82 RepID=UPI002CF5376B|nr:helix-turn-helix domain-containing protein [Hyphomicrobium sp.]HVZ04115.1 helix-turn-helix domain-containing protein [Hyphomicrobium sp.]
MQAGFTVLPNALIRRQHELRLSPIEFNVIVHLLMHWWFADAMPFPSTERISSAIGVSERTVARNFKSLERKGLLRRVPRRSEANHRETNLYDLSLLVAAIGLQAEALLPEREAKKRMAATREVQPPS